MADLTVVWRVNTKTAVNKKAIEKHLISVLRRLGSEGRVKLELSLMTDTEIKTLKQRFFGRNEATDVLSFPNPDTAVDDLLGSIAISVETAAKQAQQAGVDLLTELKMLASHGLLHLLGYHHR